MPKSGYTWIGLSYFYDFFIHATLCLSIFAVSQSTVVTIFGPSVALKGADTDVVLYIAQVIRDQRKNVLFIGAATVTCIFCATIANFWAKIPAPVAASGTIVFVVGYFFIVSEGLKCYNAFHPDSKNIRTRNCKSMYIIRSPFRFFIVLTIVMLQYSSEMTTSLSVLMIVEMTILWVKEEVLVALNLARKW